MFMVASFSEAWIEILVLTLVLKHHLVASFSEAWIEIMSFNIITNIFRVASFSEAWIEIVNCVNIGNACPSRLLLGGVD